MRSGRNPWGSVVAIASLAILASTGGCRDDSSSADTLVRGEDVADREPVPTELEVPALLEHLRQGHARTRSLGSHRLTYDAGFELGPPGDGPLPRPVVGHGILLDQAVLDSLTLEWDENGDDDPNYRLEQHNDKHAGREIVVLGDTAYAHLAHRGWYHHELEGELHATWLDEAQHCVLDVVELAAPQLSLSEGEAAELRGRPVLRFTLSRANDRDAELLSQSTSASWRRDAEITRIDGELTLDRETGVWLAAKVEVGFTMKDSEGRLLEGRTHIDAGLELGDVEVVAPPDAVPLPERERLEIERQELLGQG